MPSPGRHQQPKAQRKSPPALGHNVCRHRVSQTTRSFRLNQAVEKNRNENPDCAENSDNAAKTEDAQRHETKRGEEEECHNLPFRTREESREQQMQGIGEQNGLYEESGKHAKMTACVQAYHSSAGTKKFQGEQERYKDPDSMTVGDVRNIGVRDKGLARSFHETTGQEFGSIVGNDGREEKESHSQKPTHT